MPDTDLTQDGGRGPSRRRSARRSRAKPRDEERGRLKAHDPFELIRWLALSQPDPRKALAELVQNSLDAGARKIRVSRVRERGVACLKIFDDGEGVIPEMDRQEALRYIATHVGHSRKRDLSPQQRLALMTQGQYGIGLLGFWSLGDMLEMRSVVPGQRPFRLILHRDSAEFAIQPLRGRLPIDERWTEVVVAGLHREASAALIGRRAADFLASELRGQLLSREVELLVEDRMSRGRAPKMIPVRPPRFLGERLEGIGPVEVPDCPPARLEVYLSGGGDSGNGAEEPHGLAVYSSGTLVAESFHELAALGLDHPPWTDPRLTGLVDFPGFTVAPGSRRGVIPDEAAGAFARAIVALEPVLNGLLESLDRRRTEEMDRSLIRDLQRAFRDFYRQRPRYSMLPVNPEKDPKAGPSAGRMAVRGDDGAEESGEHGNALAGESGDVDEHSARAGSEDQGEDEASAGEAGSELPELPAPRTPPPDLLPPGPLAEVRISPSPVRVACGGAKRVRAAALDAASRTVDEDVAYTWELIGPAGSLSPVEGSHAQVILHASEHPADGTLKVIARAGEREVFAEADVEVVEEIASIRSAEGIPNPDFIHEPSASWRSRMLDERWQVNSGHRDYRPIAERPVLKLRYLAMLFAKEVVLRSSQDPRLDRPLEQLVEVAAYADRNLAERRGRRSAARRSPKKPD